jgi:hypothetical protein
MKKLNNIYNFNDFLLEYKDLKNDIFLTLSDSFKKLIKNSNNENLKKLLNFTKEKGKYPISFIDIDIKNPNLITFLNNKDIDAEYPWNSNKRQKSKIGKILNKLLNLPIDEIEKSVNIYKSTYKEKIEEAYNRFEIVKGEKLVYWYDYQNYDEQKGPLGNSCMKHAKYLELYEKNPDKVKLLILKNEEGDKIRGRALIWNLDEPENEKFLDRIYTIEDSDVELFINYAKNNGWLYKTLQGQYSGDIINPKINKKVKKLKVYIDIDIDYTYYPYLDTLYYYNKENGLLSNIDDEYDVILNDVDGGIGYENSAESYRDELMQTSLEDIINQEDPGLDILIVHLSNDTNAYEDFITSEFDYYYENLVEFIDSYSSNIENFVDDDDILKHTKPIFYSKFYDKYSSEIVEYLEQEYKYNGEEDVEKVKKWINDNDINIEEIIRKLGYDEYYNEIWEDRDIAELILKKLDYDKIIKNCLKNQFTDIEDFFDTFGKYFKIPLIYENVDKEKYINRIIENLVNLGYLS